MSSPDAPEMTPEEEIQAEGGELIADVGEETREIRAFAEKILGLKDGEEISDEMVQQAMTALVRLYTVKFQLGERWPPFETGKPMPATAVMIMSSAMLRAVNVEVFELGLWQSWSGA